MPPETLHIPAAPHIPRAGAALDANTRLRQTLARLRRGIARHLVLQTVSWLVIAFVAWAFASFLLDYLVRMTVPQRAIILAAGAALLGFIVWRWLIRPLRQSVRDEDLALVLENHFPQLEDRVITTLQLAAKAKTADGTSQQLLDAVAEEALEQVNRVSITDPLNSQRLRKRLFYGFLVAALFAAPWLIPASQPWMKIWAQRVLLLQADMSYPRQTHLKVFRILDGEPVELKESNRIIRIGRGEDLDILVVASGFRIPPNVRFDLQFASSGRLRETVDRAEADRFNRKFFNVIEPFSFSVVGGDDETATFSVEVVDPPVLSAMEFECEYPAYTALPKRKYTGSEGGLDAVVGTTVTVRVLASKPLRAGKLLLNSARISELTLKPEGNGSLLEGRFQLTDPQRHSGMLRFSLTDSEGFTTEAFSYPFTTMPDRAPLVKVMTKGVSDRITPNARVPLEIEASDDYGISQTLLVHVRRPEGKEEGAEEKTSAIESAPQNRAQFIHNHPWEVEPLGLKPDDILIFRAEALDAVQGRGQSGAISLRVVKPEVLLEEIRRQLRLYAQELERLLKRQRDTTIVTRVSRDILMADKPNALAEETQKIQEVIAGERDLGNTLQTLSEQFARLASEMENNRVGNPDEHKFWRERAVAPIAEVSKQVLGALVSRLGDAQGADQSATAVEKLQHAIREQESVETKLEAIYVEISAVSEWGPIIEELRRLLDRARENKAGIEELEKKLLEEFLKGGNRPK
jgi:hypothetical protein